MSVGDKVIFKFNTVPTHTTVGIGSTTTNDFIAEKNGSTYKLWRSGYSQVTLSNVSWTNGSEYMLEIYTESNATRIKEYMNGNYIAWWNTQWTGKNVRVDRFDNNLVDVDIIVI